MARPLRLEQPGAVWHVTSRGNNRAAIFCDDADRVLFLDLLGETVKRSHFLVHEYTLMTNHYHLVIETPETTLSRGMKWLNQTYAQRMNKKYGRSGHFFQGRFGSELIEKEAYLLEVLRYTVLNPVRAGMVERPEDYRWSSYRAKLGPEPVPEWLCVNDTLSHFGNELAAQRDEYRKFVEAGASIEHSPFDDLVARLFLGRQAWIERMQKLVDEEPRSSDHPAPQRYAGRPKVDKVIATVAEVFSDGAQEIRERHGGVERQFVAWLCCYETNERYGKVAAALRLRSSSRVSALVRECGESLARDALLGIAMDRCVDLLRGSLQVTPAIHRESYPGTAAHQ